ncbi:hypothetical protein [Peptoniphilus sp. oral taxon 386]|uniref:hypothetical protein n=1 Tax=Peptoniphilus sp. oral taxon 386 TaxID=652713 RepID=UPI000586D33B|nr:hypothetical protein [Peptoniphilus sp. oral taxon 386]
MKNLSNKFLFLILLTMLLTSFALGYFGYINLKKVNSVQLVYKEKNKTLKEDIKLKEDNINSIKSKLDLLKEQVKEINEIDNKYSKIQLPDSESSVMGYESYILKIFKPNYDISRYKSISEKTNSYRKLIATFFGDDEVMDLEEAKSNILIGNILMNDKIFSYLNEKVVENNNRIFKKIGLYKYLEKTNNFFIKYVIFEKISEEKSSQVEAYTPLEMKEFSSNILYLKDELIGIYDNVLYPDEKNILYLNDIKNAVNEEKKSINYTDNFKKYSYSIDTIKDMYNCMTLSIDINSQNIDYLNGYDILDKTFEIENNIQVLRYLTDNRKRLYLIEERSNGKPIKLVYFSASGKPYFELDIQNYKGIYFNFEKTKEIKNKYNEAIKLYNKF